MTDILREDRFDRERLLASMLKNGSASVPMIQEDFRVVLQEEAKRLQNTPRIFGVEFLSCKKSELYNQLRLALGGLINSNFKTPENNHLEEGFCFNEITQVTYGFLGSIGPHRDGGFRGLMCIAVIDGRSRFYSSSTGEDRDFRRTRVHIPAKPGDVIFMRAPGLQRTTIDICHQVGLVTSLRRDSLVFRYSPYSLFS